MTGVADALAALGEALADRPPVASLLATRERVALGGLWSASAALVVGRVAAERSRVVAIAPSAEAAESLVLDLATACPELPVSLLPVEEQGLEEGPELRANRSERLVALSFLRDGGAGVSIVPAPVLLEELPAPEDDGLTLARGDRLPRAALLQRLAAASFERVPLVAAPGEFSLRGDILDVYPWAAEAPVRIELDDELVEELRRFEVDTQRSVEVLERVALRLGSGRGERRGFMELLPADAFALLVDPPRLRDRLVEVAFERDLTPRRVEAVLAELARRPGGDLHALDLGRPECDLSLQSVGRDPRPLTDVLSAWRAQGRTVVLLCDSEGECERLAATLAEHGLPGADGAWLRLAVGRLTAGFAFPGGGPVLVHHHELIGRRAVRRRRPQRVVATRALDSLAELHGGDYVVHLLHGVARYRGMQRLAREQGEEDFLVLEFAEETKLFVPASRIDLVERFIGGDARGPKLDRIGGKTWGRKKERVARAVRDLAAELLDLQAARQGGPGFAFPVDEPLQARFESTFPYEDTPDQHRSWEQVRGDMAAPKPMDRLVVGDVGFGKTELAIRAAYLSVLAGKQVAVLVPTTILAEQHFDTFSHRMAEEPVRVEVLSRLRSDGRSKTVLADLEAGRVDIVIGTHRLLGADVRFHDLGLVVVDEEQRFGVTHKERLKRLRASVDVLTLSATPIPRTLHMALAGLRDISTIRTPPPGRRAVITRVLYDTDEVVRDGVRHEVGRGGQVFLLHNRVQTIGQVHERVRGLVPTARTAIAHGQMPARELQQVVEDFARGELDVLVCTTIIESGIDIPRANTMIVTDAHRFGLADMHQLRGRVGRENRQAYTLFLVPQQTVPEGARRRLKAIEEFSSLDAGLPIALRDLELRGAGNLLGAEQSGHIMAVGYDMYCRLLRSAVASAGGKPAPDEPGEVEVELGLSAYLPVEYVPDESVRMSLLRRLATAGRRRTEALAAELLDRFGPLPPPARELLDLFRLRRLVRLAGIGSLAVDGLGSLTLTIKDEQAFDRARPFDPGESFPFTPTRVRVPLPAGVETPTERLRYLLERFRRRRAALAAGGAPG